MKIEITTKQLIVTVITIAVLSLSFTVGYFVGFDKGGILLLIQRGR